MNEHEAFEEIARRPVAASPTPPTAEQLGALYEGPAPTPAPAPTTATATPTTVPPGTVAGPAALVEGLQEAMRRIDQIEAGIKATTGKPPATESRGSSQAPSAAKASKPSGIDPAILAENRRLVESRDPVRVSETLLTARQVADEVRRRHPSR